MQGENVCTYVREQSRTVNRRSLYVVKSATSCTLRLGSPCALKMPILHSLCEQNTYPNKLWSNRDEALFVV